jgi:hypothetical protein
MIWCRARLTRGRSTFLTLSGTFLHLVRPAALDGDAGIDCGRGGEQAGAAIHADHIEPLAAEAATQQIAEEVLPFGGALRTG